VTAYQTIDEAWKSEQVPAIDAVYCADGSVVIMDVVLVVGAGGSEPVVRPIAKCTLDSVMQFNSDHCADIVPIGVPVSVHTTDGRVFAAAYGEGRQGGDGFVALLSATNGRLVWLAFFRSSNPFVEVESDSEVLRARSTSKWWWEFPIDVPERVRLSRHRSAPTARHWRLRSYRLFTPVQVPDYGYALRNRPDRDRYAFSDTPSDNWGQGGGLEPVHSYWITLSRAEFRGAFGAAYTPFVADILHDEAFDEGDFEEINALRALAWPSADELVSKRQGLCLRIAQSVLGAELLDRVLPWSYKDMVAPAFQIDTLDRVDMASDSVVLSGTAYALDLQPLRGP